jgi:hypothetical protein
MEEIEVQIHKNSDNAINEIINPTKHYAKVDSKIMENDPTGLSFILR